MRKLLLGVAALPFLASIALADQPMTLVDSQMDSVTAGIPDQFFPGTPGTYSVTIHNQDYYGDPSVNPALPLPPATGPGAATGWHGPTQTVFIGTAPACAAAGACYHPGNF